MKNQKNGIEYIGGFQLKDTILEQLQGPIGKGKVLYPNGDCFQGYFHLSFANISGPCYCAEGEYTFADGSRIEHAWIVTSSDLEVMDLLGVYRIQHPGAPDTLTPFLRGKRDGIELILGEKLSAIEWYEGEKIQELAVSSYELEQLDENRCVLRIMLEDGSLIEQHSGKMEANRYDTEYFGPHLRGLYHRADGAILEYYCYALRGLQPYDGYITIALPSGKEHQELWKKGELKKSEPERWSHWMGKDIELPDPLNPTWTTKAHIWGSHIEYNRGEWVYDGAVAEDKPNGIGKLTGEDEIRYEGEFRDGYFHGYGVLTQPDLVKEGYWENGVFQDPEAPAVPVKLHIRVVRSEWSVGGGDKPGEETKLELDAVPGNLPIPGFYWIRVERATDKEIILSFNKRAYKLTPGEKLHFSESYEGREWSDGCVYDGTDYSVTIKWP